MALPYLDVGQRHQRAGGLVRPSRFQDSFVRRDVRVLEFLDVRKVMAFHHRHGVTKHLGDILDQRALADVPYRAGVAELVRMRWAHSKVGLHFGDLGTIKQILKLYAPQGHVRFQLELGTTKWLALRQFVQQRDHTSRKDHDCAFAGLLAFVVEGAYCPCPDVGTMHRRTGRSGT